jgi:ribose transport system permease protein
MSDRTATDQSARPENSVRSVDVAPAPAADRRRWRVIDLWATVGPLTVFVILFALVAILRPAFLGGGGLSIVATQCTAILLVALGQCLVLNVGSIDLSNAAIALFSAILLAKTIGPAGAGGLVLVIVLGAAIGALNGFLVSFFQVPSFALTLGTLGILRPRR